MVSDFARDTLADEITDTISPITITSAVLITGVLFSVFFSNRQDEVCVLIVK